MNIVPRALLFLSTIFIAANDLRVVSMDYPVPFEYREGLRKKVIMNCHCVTVNEYDEAGDLLFVSKYYGNSAEAYTPVVNRSLLNRWFFPVHFVTIVPEVVIKAVPYVERWIVVARQIKMPESEWSSTEWSGTDWSVESAQMTDECHDDNGHDEVISVWDYPLHEQLLIALP